MTQWHGGKGSTQRPKSIADEEYAQRWDAIFGRDKPTETTEIEMPDITMCDDKECPMKEQCYRYTAKPNEFRQAYFVNSPKKMDGCDYFTPVEDSKHDS
jgi:hypothetical protein